jgi:hypothetical protein
MIQRECGLLNTLFKASPSFTNCFIIYTGDPDSVANKEKLNLRQFLSMTAKNYFCSLEWQGENSKETNKT